MATQYRLTMFMQEPRQGWSESWYLERDTTNLIDIWEDLKTVVVARAKLLGNEATCYHHRVSKVLLPSGKSPAPRLTFGDDFESTPSTSSPLVPTDVSLMVRCTTTDQAHTKISYLGGCAKAALGKQNLFTPTPAWQTLFDAWAAAVKNARLGWLSQEVSQSLDVTAYTFNAATGRTTLTLSEALTFAAGQKTKRVTVNMPPGHEALDGVYLVSPVAADPLQVVTSKPRPTQPAAGLEGNLKAYNYVFRFVEPAIGQGASSRVQGSRFVKRSRGKVSYASVGRKPAVVRW